MNIPTWASALSALMAAIAWMVFSRTLRIPGLSWLFLPFLAQALVYLWYFCDGTAPPSYVARPAVVLVAITQTTALLFVSYLQSRHGK
jgi:hypothetical protein